MSLRSPILRNTSWQFADVVLGLTLETVSRTMTVLKTQALIALHGPAEVELLNIGRLRALAGTEQ